MDLISKMIKDGIKKFHKAKLYSFDVEVELKNTIYCLKKSIVKIVKN